MHFFPFNAARKPVVFNKALKWGLKHKKDELPDSMGFSETYLFQNFHKQDVSSGKTTIQRNPEDKGNSYIRYYFNFVLKKP